MDWMDDFLEDTQMPKVSHYPWMDTVEMALGTKDNIDAIIDSCIESGLYAIDLETSGLDNRVFNGCTVDFIAGICLSPDGERGYYIPIMHDPDKYGEHNVPSSVWRPAMRRLVESEAVAIFHNGKFDQEFLQWNGDEPLGEWDKPKQWEDTLILAYLRNSRARRKGLKALSEAPPDADHEHPAGGPGLGMKMIELHELWGHEKKSKKFFYDFTTLDPSWRPSIEYAASDAICTYRLYKLLADEVVAGQKSVYLIEKLCVASTRWMERNRVFVDSEKVIELVKLGQQEWIDSIMELYAEASKILERDIMPGHYKLLRDIFVPDDHLFLVNEQIKQAKAQSQQRYPDPQGTIKVRGKEYPLIYDVNSPQQLGQMFAEMKVPGLKYTEKTGQVVTKKEVLNAIIEKAGEKFPFMAYVKRFREIWKALASYLYPMLLDVEPTDKSMRISFNGHKVDTGRFSTPAKDASRAKVPGWPQLNLQSMPATYDPYRPECMTRLRECIIARVGNFIVAIDYAGVELRIVTNLSLEPKWLTEFFRCSSCEKTFNQGDGTKTPPPPPPRCPNCGSDKIGDLHTLTALNFFGEDSINKPNWKKLRGDGKASNFALCYGGGGTAVMRSTGCDKQEGWRRKRAFDSTYKVLSGWWSGQHAFAKKHGYVQTGFGRRYPVPDIHSADGGFRAKAERNSVNGPVQGTSADITKIAMGLIYKEFKKRGWLEKARMIITMHDELVFDIHPSVLEEAIEVAKHIMTSNKMVLGRKWRIPYTTDVEIGHNWTVPWDLNSMRAAEVRFNGNKKYKGPDKAEADGLNWSDLPTFPSDLYPYFTRQSFDGPPITPSAPPPVQPTTVPPPTPAAAPEAPVEATPPMTKATISEPPPPTVQQKSRPVPESSNGECVYHLQAPLTLTTVMKLADIIRQCRNGGSKVLRLKSIDGASLDRWSEAFGHPEVKVSDQEFHILARSAGL
jgi:DNA polymerase I-like protein with 3'-5' exonuclease and polymerase domains